MQAQSSLEHEGAGQEAGQEVGQEAGQGRARQECMEGGPQSHTSAILKHWSHRDTSGQQSQQETEQRSLKQ